MSERLDNLQRREQAIEAARNLLDEPYQLGSITVAYNGDYAAYSSVWILATCSDCPMELASWASHESQIRSHAIAGARRCGEFGHEQPLEELMASSMPEHLQEPEA